MIIPSYLVRASAITIARFCDHCGVTASSCVCNPRRSIFLHQITHQLHSVISGYAPPPLLTSGFRAPQTPIVDSSSKRQIMVTKRIRVGGRWCLKSGSEQRRWSASRNDGMKLARCGGIKCDRDPDAHPEALLTFVRWFKTRVLVCPSVRPSVRRIIDFCYW